jgi:hypothetical protein
MKLLHGGHSAKNRLTVLQKEVVNCIVDRLLLGKCCESKNVNPILPVYMRIFYVEGKVRSIINNYICTYDLQIDHVHIQYVQCFWTLSIDRFFHILPKIDVKVSFTFWCYVV